MTRTHMHTHKAWEWCKLNYSFSKACILNNIQHKIHNTKKKLLLKIQLNIWVVKLGITLADKISGSHMSSRPRSIL